MLCIWLKDKEQGKNIVVVGSWNTEDHMNWAKKNVARSYHLKDDGAQKVKYDYYISLTYKVFFNNNIYLSYNIMLQILICHVCCIADISSGSYLTSMAMEMFAT